MNFDIDIPTAAEKYVLDKDIQIGNCFFYELKETLIDAFNKIALEAFYDGAKWYKEAIKEGGV